MCHLTYLCRFEIIPCTHLRKLPVQKEYLIQAQVNTNIFITITHISKGKQFKNVSTHTHNIYQDQTIMLLIGGNDGGIFFYATAIISITTGSICGGISIDFYSDIGGIDQLCSPVSYVCMCLYKPICVCCIPKTD